MKYDLESFLGDIKQICLDNLNAKLAQIDAEKNDVIKLKTVDPLAYFLQSLNGSIANFDPFILYGVESIDTVGTGPFTADTFQVSVIACLVDNGQEIDIASRVLRYGRALKEIFGDNWNNSRCPKIEIKSEIPVSLPSLNSSDTIRAIGVTITASIGGP